MPPARRYYPAFVDIEGKKCVVVGGGKVAERKVRDLLRAGADVRVISPDLTAGLDKLADSGRIKHTARRFRSTDLTKSVFLAIAATDDNDVNLKVARRRGDMLVNVVDKPELCSFIVPSSLRRGPLTIAVSTSGASPAMARSIRRELESIFGREVGQYLDKVCRMREKALRDIRDPAERERRLRELGSEKALHKLLGKMGAAGKGCRK